MMGVDCNDDPVKWNQLWEQFIAADPAICDQDFVEICTATSDSSTEQVLLSKLSGGPRMLCRLQHDLTLTAGRYIALHGFETKWLEISARERESHLLKGMVVAATSQPMYENCREYCEEVTLPHLQASGGKGFLTLLQHFIIDDPTSVPTTPILLSSARWDRMVGRTKHRSGLEKAWQLQLDLSRNMLICE